MREKKEISLIMLVIIIVIVLTLVGFTLRLILGENGKIEFDKDEETNEVKELNEYLEKIDLPENSEKNAQPAGTIVNSKKEWEMPLITVKTEEDIFVTEIKESVTVYAVSVGEGETIPVPKGFYYVGGTLSSGVVISDDARDYNKYAGEKEVPTGVVYDEDGIVLIYNEEDYEALSKEEQRKLLLGNQFVWIPCDGKNISNLQVNSIELASIKRYGGFYVGRYEAGTSKIVFANEAALQNPSETDANGINAEYLSNLVLEGEITSKAGEIPYYYADLDTAIEMSENMYESRYVQSELISGMRMEYGNGFYRSKRVL